MFRYFRLLFLLSIFIGCSFREPYFTNIEYKVSSLTQLLLTLKPSIETKEAEALAQDSIYYSHKLAQKYEVVNSPWFQNFLVNIGIKRRGLCYEWTEDLLTFLLSKKYKSLEFHTVGANIGSLNEHNALSVSAKGLGIQKSILLDAWRNSGNLYFTVIEKDKNYKWSERFNLYGLLPPRSGKK